MSQRQPLADIRRCACQPGRDHDGSEFGPCEYCEACADEEFRQQALERDAARWRFTQLPGFYLDPSCVVDDVEANVVAVYLGRQWVGIGHSQGSAIDCALMLTNTFGDEVPADEVLRIFDRHYRSTWDGARWQKPPRPDFSALADRLEALLVDSPAVVSQP